MTDETVQPQAAGDGLEKADSISYEKLYEHWERHNWSASAIDFTTDKVQWRENLTERQRESALWNYAMFLVGEEAVARTLTPILDSAPGYAQSLFLTTQVVDEARHHVFFDRFMREVAAQGRDTKTTLDEADRYLTWGFRQVFDELDRVTEMLRRKPKDMPLVAQAIALYHVIIEGMLAVPGQHFIQRYVRKFEILPGFRAGIDNVSRDESRHVAFGIKYLGDLFRQSKECRDAAIEEWNRVFRWTSGVFIPPNMDPSYAECFDFTLEEIYAFGLRSFVTKARRLGIEPFEEIRMLGRLDKSLSYEEHARNLWVFIKAGIIGDDRREPQVTPEALELLFDGMTRAVDLDVARSLGGPVLWDFSDAEPWHLVVTNGHAEAKPGRVDDAALTLEVSAADWAKISVERADPRMALLKRRLRLHGSFGAKAKLPKLFA